MFHLREGRFAAALTIGVLTAAGGSADASAGAVSYGYAGGVSAAVSGGQYAVGDRIIGSFTYDPSALFTPPAKDSDPNWGEFDAPSFTNFSNFSALGGTSNYSALWLGSRGTQRGGQNGGTGGNQNGNNGGGQNDGGGQDKGKGGSTGAGDGVTLLASSNMVNLDSGENTTPLTAVPEPGSLALFGMALVGLGIMIRRRRLL